MFLFVFRLCCVLQPILHYYCVFGKRESLQRFVVEDGAKPAIFGSYSYDPVKQVFVPPPPDANYSSRHHSTTEIQIEIQTETEIQTEKQTEKPTETRRKTQNPTSTDTQSLPDSFISTAGDTGTDSTAADDRILRKHVLPPPNNKPWWARAKTTFKNVTFNFI